MMKKTLVTVALTAAGLGGLGLVPAPANAGHTPEQCANGLVIVHSNGSSAWAESGDAKYQLVGIDGRVSGAFLDKSGTLQTFSDTFQKEWTSGKKDVAVVCDGENHWSDPSTGEYFDESFRATLREVQ